MDHKVPKLKKKKEVKSKKTFLGMLLSALNFFPIPYYVFVSITLSSYDIFSFELSSILTLLVVLGSFIVFYFTSNFFKDRIKQTTCCGT
jgi:hypothetical protein